MNNHRKLAALLWLAVLFSGALAQTAPTPLFDAACLPPTFLTPPPAVGSPAWNAEIDQIVDLQTRADPAAVAQAGRERRLTPDVFLQPIIPQLTREDFPRTFGLLERLEHAANAALGPAKAFYNTRRPFLMSPRIQALVEPDHNPAYPSGHTTCSYLWARVIGSLLPDYRAVLLARAEEIAQHRVLVGMHFPHDVRGGRELALLVVGALSQDPAFQHELSLARDELVRSGLLAREPSSVPAHGNPFRMSP